MNVSDPTANEAKPKLFLYALILPAVWLTIGFIVLEIAPGFRFGVGGSALMITAICVGISWLILKRHGRLPTNGESWRLIAYCSALAVFLESWTILAALAWPEDFPGLEISRDSALMIIGIAAVVDTLIVTLAFKIAAPRFLQKQMPDAAS